MGKGMWYNLDEMATAVDSLWSYVKGRKWLSARELLQRLGLAADTVDQEDLDYRSRLLIRDSLDALAGHYGRSYVESRIARMPSAGTLQTTWHAKFDDDTGFPSLKDRIMEPLTHDDVLNYLRDLARDIRTPTTVTIGGSVALILRDLVIRDTEDIDVVNEVPASIRELHTTLDRLKERHELILGHFQSHYLPTNWERRTTLLETFGPLQVRLVDAIDVLLTKLFSIRSKDFVDLRSAWKLIDRDLFRERLARETGELRSIERLLEPAKHNWYVLTGEEDLPPLM